MSYRKKKKHQYDYGKSKRSRLCELQRSGSIINPNNWLISLFISENLEVKAI